MFTELVPDGIFFCIATIAIIVAEPHQVDADPDPVFCFCIRLFSLIRIRFLIKVMGIWNHWPPDLHRLQCEPQRLQDEPPRRQ